MKRHYSAALTTIFLLCHCFSGNSCPAHCNCFAATMAMCSDEHLAAVPHNISDTVTQLVIMTTGLEQVQADALRHAPQLTTLVFLNNALRGVAPSAFDALPSLRELEISGNQHLDDVAPGTFDKLGGLIRLLLNYNSFRTLDSGLFDSLQQLETLELRGNRLYNLPGRIFRQLSGLQHLDLSLNQLTEVDRELLAGFRRLETLRLGYNHIKALPADVFANIPGVRDLGLQGNRLSDVPRDAFSHLECLQKLNLRGNLITNVSAGAFPPSLTELNLRGNRIARLPPDVFGGLSGLTLLTLSENRLSGLPPSLLRDLTSLVRLDLSENRLASLPGDAFSSLARVQQVDLHRNNLSSLNAGLFENNSALEQLYLSDNSLRTLPEGFIQPFLLSLTMLRIHGNPWRCDCHFLFLYDWALDPHQTVEELSKVACAEPALLRGRSLVSLDRSQLVCIDNSSSGAHPRVSLPARTSEGELRGAGSEGPCTVRETDGSLLVSCSVKSCSGVQVEARFHKTGGEASEFTIRKEWRNSSQCLTGSVTVSVQGKGLN